MRFSLLVGLVAIAISTSLPAQAQSWLERAQDALNSDTGKQVLDTLGGQAGTSSVSSLTSSEIIAGLKQALEVGTNSVVAQLGVSDGFNLDPSIRIPLPDTLARVDQTLSQFGLGALTDDLELRLNRAAEAATPKAKELFLSAITNMTIDDGLSILNGPEDSATQYLLKTMGPGLRTEMQPIVQSALNEAGAVMAYDSVMGQYSQIPFMPDVKANLNEYVVDKAMDGIFFYVAQEEAAIRADPAARTTELLEKVFAK